MTKSGLDLVQHLSALFNDVYNKRLPPSDDDDLPLLSLFNGTGRELFIDKLDNLEVGLKTSIFPLIHLLLFFAKFANDSTIKSVTLEQNQSIPLKVPNEHQVPGRLSVIEDENFKKRQEFTVKVKIPFILF
jgi:hypothetical protein